MGRSSWSTRQCVEGSLSISFTAAEWREVLSQSEHKQTILSWLKDGSVVGRISCYRAQGGRALIIACLLPVALFGSMRPYYVTVPIQKTPCYFGGARYWFLCPNSACGRRVGKLYLATGKLACRKCHNLTYRSSKEYDHLVYALARDPERLKALFMVKSPRLPVIKAAFRLMELRHKFASKQLQPL